MPSPWVRRALDNDLPAKELSEYAQAKERLSEERESGCASPQDITFWQSEVLRLGRDNRDA